MRPFKVGFGKRDLDRINSGGQHPPPRGGRLSYVAAPRLASTANSTTPSDAIERGQSRAYSFAQRGTAMGCIKLSEFAAIVSVSTSLIGFNASATIAGAYAYTTSNFPGATSTTPYGVNDSDSVSGFYDNPSNGYHGFVQSGGGYSTAPVRETVYGINNSGTVVGIYDDGANVPHGFIDDLRGNQLIFDVPGALYTSAFGINEFGSVVGTYNTGAVGVVGFHSFSYIQGVFATVSVPGAITTYAQGINDVNWISGYYVDSTNNTHGFVDEGGSYITYDVPGALFGTAIYGINNAGDFVGYFADGSGFHAFVDSDGSISKLTIPDATGATVAYGINNSGSVVGSFNDASGTHGFLATPAFAVPEPSTWLLMIIGFGGVGGALRKGERVRPQPSEFQRGRGRPPLDNMARKCFAP